MIAIRSLQEWQPPSRDEYSNRSYGAAITVADACVERFIGSIRRDCLDHVIVVIAAGLHLRSCTHFALGKDTPVTRLVSPLPAGRIVAIAEVGGRHHRYDRIAA